MSTVVVSRRTVATWRNPLGRYMPQAFGAQSRREFTRRRRQEYLEEADGKPTPSQVRLISHAISVEWSALDAEHTAYGLTGSQKVEALRIAAEYRRQLNLALWHFQKTLPQSKVVSAEPGPPKASASLPDIIAEAVRAGK